MVAYVWCDGVGCPVVSREEARGQIGSSDLQAIRRALAERGWVRMRPAGATGYGDYCPRCAAGIRQTRGRVRS